MEVERSNLALSQESLDDNGGWALRLSPFKAGDPVAMILDSTVDPERMISKSRALQRVTIRYERNWDWTWAMRLEDLNCDG